MLALEGPGANKCDVTDLFGLFEVLYLAAEGEVRLVRHMFRSFWVGFVCNVGIWPAQPRYYLLYGRNVFIGYSAVGDVEQFLG